MRTAVVSDLHLGTELGNDVARRADVRARLTAALAEADRVVFLGDLVELREQPVEVVLADAGPALADLAEAVAGKPVVLVPGNHDHRVVEPLIDGMRSRGQPLGLDWTGDLAGSGIGRELAGIFSGSELTLAYPGFRLRGDVYALHGHHLDVHMTMPRVESVIGSAFVRAMLRDREGGPRGADDYERALAPMYSFSYSLAQGLAGKASGKQSSLSRDIWARANSHDRRGPLDLLLARVAIPAGVAALNRAGLGPYSSTLTAPELRRAGLRAIGEALGRLGVEAEHVLFGHTHRMGPLPGDDFSEWRTPGGASLWNTGSWYREKVLVGDRTDSPYWPGGLIWVGDSGPPEPVNLLRDLRL